MALNAVSNAKAGIASGVLATSRQIGTLLGVAVYGTLLTAFATSHGSGGGRGVAGKPDAIFVESAGYVMLFGAALATVIAVAVIALLMAAPGRRRPAE